MIILDGGTGTLIQLLGAPMNDETWGADANLTHPEIVREAHRQYLAAGAEVLIANTYATSPFSSTISGATAMFRSSMRPRCARHERPATEPYLSPVRSR
jgi:S-methylmethionine-dependent homocysteine/selenocysteine methylase